MTKYVIIYPANRASRLIPAALLPGHDVTGCEVIAVPDDFTWDGKRPDFDALAIVDDIESAQATALDRVSLKFTEELAKGCASPKGWADCDDKAASRVANAIKLIETMTELGETPPAEIAWTMFDKTTQPHSLLDLKILGVAIGVGFQTKFGVKQGIEQAIASATTLAEIEAVDIDAGWP